MCVCVCDCVDDFVDLGVGGWVRVRACVCVPPSLPLSVCALCVSPFAQYFLNKVLGRYNYLDELPTVCVCACVICGVRSLCTLESHGGSLRSIEGQTTLPVCVCACVCVSNADHNIALRVWLCVCMCARRNQSRAQFPVLTPPPPFPSRSL